MKQLLLFAGFGLFALYAAAQGQDSWTVKWNKKTILKASGENEATHTRTIRKTDLGRKCRLELVYKESDPAKVKTWKRSFLLYGESDNEVMRIDSTRSFSLTAAELKEHFGDQKMIRIYTMAIPSDPDVAARVRVRRIHLCTLRLE